MAPQPRSKLLAWRLSQEERRIREGSPRDQSSGAPRRGGDEHRQLRSTHLEGAKEHHPGTELMGRMQVESVGRWAGVDVCA